MKEMLCFGLFFLMNISAFGQTNANSPYIFRLDSLPIKSLDLSSSGNLNIKQTRKTGYGEVEVLLLRGKRPVASYKYSSVDELNKSDLTAQLRSKAFSGDRMMFELKPLKGSSMYLNLAIK